MSSDSSSTEEASGSDTESSVENNSGRETYSGQDASDEEATGKLYHADIDDCADSSSEGEAEAEDSDNERNIDSAQPAQDINSSESETAIRKPKKAARITINLDYCDYDVFTEVCAGMGWKISTGRTRWNIKWIDRYLLGSTIKDMRLKAGQRINHFPAVCELAFKCKLANNLNRIRRLLPAEYSFHPDSWVLPDEMLAFTRVTTEYRNRTYIVKPNGGSQVISVVKLLRSPQNTIL
jgi:hypothetical protein